MQTTSAASLLTLVIVMLSWCKVAPQLVQIKATPPKEKSQNVTAVKRSSPPQMSLSTRLSVAVDWIPKRMRRQPADWARSLRHWATSITILSFIVLIGSLCTIAATCIAELAGDGRTVNSTGHKKSQYSNSSQSIASASHSEVRCLTQPAATAAYGSGGAAFGGFLMALALNCVAGRIDRVAVANYEAHRLDFLINALRPEGLPEYDSVEMHNSRTTSGVAPSSGLSVRRVAPAGIEIATANRGGPENSRLQAQQRLANHNLDELQSAENGERADEPSETGNLGERPQNTPLQAQEFINLDETQSAANGERAAETSEMTNFREPQNSPLRTQTVVGNYNLDEHQSAENKEQSDETTEMTNFDGQPQNSPLPAQEPSRNHNSEGTGAPKNGERTGEPIEMTNLGTSTQEAREAQVVMESTHMD